jgi:DNA transposition AAA+ family ATPase
MKTMTKEKVTINQPDIRERLQARLDTGLTHWQIAVEAGIPSAALRAWIDRGIEPEVPLLNRLEGWFKGEAQAAAQAAAKAPGFVETPTAQKVIGALDYARYAPTIAVIYGGAGVGKSTTLKHYADTRPRTWIVTAAAARKTTAAILMALVESPSRRGFAYRVDSLFAEALSFMEPAFGEKDNKGLLIVDEAQHLETPAFDMIRAFHDEAGIGIAYAGNEEVYSRIHGKKKSRLPQIFSRVGMRLRVENSTPEDADAFIEAHGITGREERKYCQLIAGMPGGLRGLNNVIRFAKLTAPDPNSPITMAELREAANECGTFNE